MKTAIELIQEERIRQVEVEGFGTGDDDRYTKGELRCRCFLLCIDGLG